MITLDAHRAAADAEHLATLAGIDTGPWKGAGERLAAAEAAEAAERAAEATAAQEAAERARGERFATVVRDYSAAIAQRVERAAAIVAIDEQLAGLTDAADTLDRYQIWRQQPAAVDHELVLRSAGGIPQQGHFLHGLPAGMLAKMQQVDDLRKQRQAEMQRAGAMDDLMRTMESEFPALKELRDDA
jgi:hypothetical protein